MSYQKYCCLSCESGNPCAKSFFRPSALSNLVPSTGIPNIPLSPTSGLFINAAGQLDIDCAILGQHCGWPIGPTEPAAVPYTWTVAPATIQEGGQVTLNAAGLAPMQLMTVRVTPAVGSIFYWPLQADVNGNIINSKLQLTDGGQTYTFTPIVVGAVPNIAQYEIVVLGCGEDVECTCQGAVSIRPVLSSYSVVSGQPVTLQLLVTNTNTCAVSNLDLPALVLPAGITAGAVSLSNETVPARASAVFEFPLQVQNTTGSDIDLVITVPASSGTYECNGNSYSAGGGSVTLTVAPATGQFCGIVIETWAFNPTSTPDGVAVDLTIAVRNIGTLAITDLNMPPLTIADADVSVAAGATTIGFGPVGLAAGALHTTTVNTTLESLVGTPHNHVLNIPVGYIYATCNGSLITTGASASAVVTLETP